MDQAGPVNAKPLWAKAEKSTHTAEVCRVACGQCYNTFMCTCAAVTDSLPGLNNNSSAGDSFHYSSELWYNFHSEIVLNSSNLWSGKYSALEAFWFNRRTRTVVCHRYKYIFEPFSVPSPICQFLPSEVSTICRHRNVLDLWLQTAAPQKWWNKATTEAEWAGGYRSVISLFLERSLPQTNFCALGC